MGSLRILAKNKNTLVTVRETGWNPFAMIHKLQFVEGQTFRIVEAGSGGIEGELVRFHPKKGYVEYHGRTFWNKEIWQQKIAGSNVISLQSHS